MALDVQRGLPHTDVALDVLGSLPHAAPRPVAPCEGVPEAVRGVSVLGALPPGFSRRDRPLTAVDVPDPGIERSDALRRVCCGSSAGPAAGQGDRLVADQYFDRIYPGAQFISLRRDPRAVVSSWEQADWLDVSTSPDSDGWQWGEVPGGYLAAWHSLGGGPLLSAALKIRLDLDDIARNAELVPGRFHELTYEDLVRDPEPTLRSLCVLRSGLDVGLRRYRPRDSALRLHRDLAQAPVRGAGSLVLEFMERTEGRRLAPQRSAPRG